jgi:hypothetical protein
MPRIRTIKPEFWADDKVVDLEVLPKLLYIGLWNFADDDGYIEASVRRIKRLIFPDNNYNVEKALESLLEAGMIARFASEQGELFQIVKFRVHQKPQHPTPTKFTGITPILTAIHEDSVTPHEGSLRSVEGSSVRVASPRVTDEDFEVAYSHWPKKTERAKSFEKFKRVAAERGLEAITADVIRFGDAYSRTTERQFVPALVVWLNGERWTDDLPGAEAPRRNVKKFVAHAD